MSKILIVEDDSEIALLERDYLEIEGLESDVVSDGESAVSAALSGGYDLLWAICRSFPGAGRSTKGSGN